VAACCGCSFSPGKFGGGGSSDVIDAPLDDSSADARLTDASPDGAPIGSDAMWVDIETMQVPCLSATVTSTHVLAAGVTYRLRTSGTCVIGSNGLLGDAEYWNFNNGTPTDIAANGTIDIGIAINDPTMDLPKQPHWGNYTSGHVYQIDWIGAGSTIDALYHEQGPSNNSGNITLVIQSLQ